jgi:hypothetical protein
LELSSCRTICTRLARFVFRQRRLVLAAWLAAAIAAIAIAIASGGQSTIVFAATNGTAKVTDPAAKAAIESAMTELKPIPQVSAGPGPDLGICSLVASRTSRSDTAASDAVVRDSAIG